ncbi:protein kinase [Pendulispora brunnea]|uniref:Protein kinase n=1 Tax=Pendulispora brunnea TaxID=2905690 RepID=A0ABZ2KHQ9_9BACT
MQVGAVLGDKYQLLATIGRGGMGEVFHALHIASGTNVAIKVVSRAMIGDLLMARLEREAAAVARIRSDYIPQLLDVDGTEEGELFLVMELLHGESLSERMKRAGGPLPWDEVHAMGDNVLRALIDAHAAGVVHRDLKPGNIFIEYANDGTQHAKVLDFGVCKLDLQDAEKLTVTGESVGTIAYMAPEQIRGASRVDERADLYSFGMVIFEALSGRIAYDAAGQMAILASKLERPARSLKTVTQVAIPLELDALIARCLARKPADRFGNAVELLHAWHAMGPPLQPPASLPSVSVGSTGSLALPTASSIEPHAVPPKGSRSALVIAIGTVLLGTAAVAAVVTRHARANAAAEGLAVPSAAVVEAPVEEAVDAAAVVEPSAPQEKAEEAETAPAGEPAKARWKAPVGTKRKAAPAGSSPSWIERPKY